MRLGRAIDPAERLSTGQGATGAQLLGALSAASAVGLAAGHPIIWMDSRKLLNVWRDQTTIWARVASGRQVRVDRPGGQIVIRYRRSGVEPSGGCILGLPIWLVTRTAWQLSSKRGWSVEIWSMRHRFWRGKVVSCEVFADQPSARAAALEVHRAAVRGEYDHYLLPDGQSSDDPE